MKIVNFGNNLSSILLGVTANSKPCRIMVNKILKESNFDYYLLQLNPALLFFIEKNQYYFSSYYQIIRDVDRKKIVCIDLTKEREINIFSKHAKEKESNLSSRKFDGMNAISYLMNKKLYNDINDSVYASIDGLHDLDLEKYSLIVKNFHQVHIKERENHMIDVINEYHNELNKLFIVVGINHFNNIAHNLI